MIGARELAAWRAYAPWSSDVQVEQDYLLGMAVAAIFEDAFLKDHVAMRGGTVLHKVHLAPASRYSEDIDLVLVTDRDPRHVKLALHRVMKPFLNEPYESIVTDERRMKSRKFLADLKGYLPAGRSYSPVQACKDFFDVYLPHLDA